MKYIGWITGLFALLLIAIIVIANQPGKNLFQFIGVIPASDKIGHFVLMGTMAFLANLWLRARRFSFGKWSPLLGSALVSIVVIFEELSQIWIPQRTFSYYDLASDFAGILVGGWLAVYVIKRWVVASETT